MIFLINLLVLQRLYFLKIYFCLVIPLYIDDRFLNLNILKQKYFLSRLSKNIQLYILFFSKINFLCIIYVYKNRIEMIRLHFYWVFFFRYHEELYI